MNKIYQLLAKMYDELARIKQSGTPEKHWKPHLKLITQLEKDLNNL